MLKLDYLKTTRTNSQIKHLDETKISIGSKFSNTPQILRYC